MVKKCLICILLAAVLLAGCGRDTQVPETTFPVAEETQPRVRVVCAGDSITYGYEITDWEENNYPAQLQKLLGEGFLVKNAGISAYAVQEDSDASYRTREEYRESLAFDGDWIVFMMGTNDSKPWNWKGPEPFREDLETLLDSYGDARIFLCTPPAAFFLDGQTEGCAYYCIQPLVVEEIARVVRQTAADRGCTLIDIHELALQNPHWFSGDGVHPTNEGAAGIAQAVYAVLSEEEP